ncbi:MAG: ABC transporter ATP-binding protein [Spirochaetaceae bacterium]|nr:ABC transporter ATP-binding protein [Spirochaetaceae bacterium]
MTNLLEPADGPGGPERSAIPVVELRNITKIYPADGFRANHLVSLDLRRGEILCLAGENGAGKSTLMSILYGLIPPTSGQISVRGKAVTIHSPLQANRLGIGMVHQHFMLFPECTVAQNVVMGREPLKWGIFYDIATANLRVEELIRGHHFSVRPQTPVRELTVGEMQQVEILRMLYRNADILILDEPTAVLTDQEIDSLFRTLRTLRDSGKSLILITHKLNEIKGISDRVAVMRAGELMAIRNTGDVDENEIARLMVGREVDLRVDRNRRKPAGTRPLISFEDVTVKSRNQKRPRLMGLSFTVHQGEILGFAGVGGNGLGVLEAVLGGFVPISSGRIRYHGRDIGGLHTEQLRRLGLAYVPADRLAVGSALNAAVWENIIINRRREFFHRGFLDSAAVEEFTGRLFGPYGIAGNPNLPMGALSGGNIQKVILAREIDQYRDYIVFSEPARGLDIAASRYVYEQMAELRDRGAAVILISSNPDEILVNADRILIFYRGAIVAEFDGIKDHIENSGIAAIKEEMGACMLGLKSRKGETREALHG